ncbi:hypothetical protein PAHAL_2G375500 [Panicum hallii]|uniref:Uncharacterized protein n=1 Tax=Panicum hallii TaxID=206008 RepID=A0A2T8KRT3_9POAL|nr:uncharacterized protein LOC112883448 [Panicum hallii]PVH64884.1 hypothetical protein PAHAL_2G375500 [Panicum hallii]
MLPFAIDVAEELGVPGISFRAASACSFLAYLTVPELFEHADLPSPGGGGLDKPVLESFVRRRDLPRLEAAVEGVPTVCWPCNIDQKTNSAGPPAGERRVEDGAGHEGRVRQGRRGEDGEGGHGVRRDQGGGLFQQKKRSEGPCELLRSRSGGTWPRQVHLRRSSSGSLGS